MWLMASCGIVAPCPISLSTTWEPVWMSTLIWPRISPAKHSTNIVRRNPCSMYSWSIIVTLYVYYVYIIYIHIPHLSFEKYLCQNRKMAPLSRNHSFAVIGLSMLNNLQTKVASITTFIVVLSSFVNVIVQLSLLFFHFFCIYVNTSLNKFAQTTRTI